MEKSIKDMLEVEGRAIGIELDKRKNARDLFNELSEKQNEETCLLRYVLYGNPVFRAPPANDSIPKSIQKVSWKQAPEKNRNGPI